MPAGYPADPAEAPARRRGAAADASRPKAHARAWSFGNRRADHDRVAAVSTDRIEFLAPVPPPEPDEGSSTFTLDRPLTGVVVGLRLDRAWRSYITVVDVWEQLLKADGATAKVLWTGDRAGPEAEPRPATTSRSGPASSRSASSVSAIEARARRGVSTTPSLSRSSAKPAVVVVTAEFDRFATQIATHHGHPSLRKLVLPYPLEGLPEEELRADCYGRVPNTPRRSSAPQADALAADRVDVEARPVELYELLARATSWGDGLPLLPPDRGAGPGADRRHAVARRRRHRRAAAASTARPPSSSWPSTRPWPACDPKAFPYVIAALEAICEPEFNLYGLTHHHVERHPACSWSTARRATRLGIDYEAGCMGGAGGRGLDDHRPRALAVPAQHRRADASGDTSKSVFGQPAPRRRPVLRRVGGALAVAVARRSSGATGRRPTSSPSTAARARSRSPTSTTTTRATCCSSSPSRIAIPAVEQVPHADRRGNGADGRRDQPDVGRALRPRLPRHRGLPGVPPRARLAADRPVAARRTRRSCDDEGPRRRAGAACHRAPARPVVLVVCGGLGNLHAIVLPSWGDSSLQHQAVGEPRVMRTQ